MRPIEKRLAAVEARKGAADPFAHLSDGELGQYILQLNAALGRTHDELRSEMRAIGCREEGLSFIPNESAQEISHAAH